MFRLVSKVHWPKPKAGKGKGGRRIESVTKARSFFLLFFTRLLVVCFLLLSRPTPSSLREKTNMLWSLDWRARAQLMWLGTTKRQDGQSGRKQSDVFYHQPKLLLFLFPPFTHKRGGKRHKNNQVSSFSFLVVFYFFLKTRNNVPGCWNGRVISADIVSSQTCWSPMRK